MSPPTVGITTADIRIPSHGEQLAAYLYRPAGPGPVPCVVMAHGFSGTRDDALPGYAEAFAAAGMAAVVFDYRWRAAPVARHRPPAAGLPGGGGVGTVRRGDRPRPHRPVGNLVQRRARARGGRGRPGDRGGGLPVSLHRQCRGDQPAAAAHHHPGQRAGRAGHRRGAPRPAAPVPAGGRCAWILRGHDRARRAARLPVDAGPAVALAQRGRGPHRRGRRRLPSGPLGRPPVDAGAVLGSCAVTPTATSTSITTRKPRPTRSSSSPGCSARRPALPPANGPQTPDLSPSGPAGRRPRSPTAGRRTSPGTGRIPPACRPLPGVCRP